MKIKKVPEFNGIPTRVYKLMFHHRLDILLGEFNACLNGSVFSLRWRMARLLLLSKRKEDSETLSPGVKVLEMFIKDRLTDAVRVTGFLSPGYYDFRFTLDVAKKILDAGNILRNA